MEKFYINKLNRTRPLILTSNLGDYPTKGKCLSVRKLVSQIHYESTYLVMGL